MVKSYHICLTSCGEVLFRSKEDFYRGVNCYAISLIKHNSTNLADCFMSNHVHFVIQTNDVYGVIKKFKVSYTMYFNNKYGRVGKLFNDLNFVIEVEGLYHHLCVLSYVMRNPLHHGVAPTPYAYEFSSANTIYKKELGKYCIDKLLKKAHYKKYIGKDSKLPDNIRVNSSGMILREDFTDVVLVERMYSTARSFNFYMSRKSSEEWLKEQDLDYSNTGSECINASDNSNIVDNKRIKSTNASGYKLKENSFIDLKTIEKGYLIGGNFRFCNFKIINNDSIGNDTKIDNYKQMQQSLKAIEDHYLKMLYNENGKCNYKKISDTELCSLINDFCITQYHKRSIYFLTDSEKNDLYRFLMNKYNPGTKQLHRCLAL